MQSIYYKMSITKIFSAIGVAGLEQKMERGAADRKGLREGWKQGTQVG